MEAEGSKVHSRSAAFVLRGEFANSTFRAPSKARSCTPGVPRGLGMLQNEEDKAQSNEPLAQQERARGLGWAVILHRILKNNIYIYISSNLHDFFLIISPFLPIFNVNSLSKLIHESNFASNDGF